MITKRLLNRHPLLYRLRFALITSMEDKEIFNRKDLWPDHATPNIPAVFIKKVHSLKLDKSDHFESAKAIAFDLSRGHKRGHGIGRDSSTALDLIYTGRAGVCSDYSQVFLGLCYAAGILAREWGVTEDLVVKHDTLGHSFNEVYSPCLGKWVFIDPSRSIYATNRATGAPLGATELIDFTTSGTDSQVLFHYIDRAREGKESCPNNDVYLNFNNIFFLITNNNIFEQDRFLSWADFFPLPLLHAIMILCGKYQRFIIYTNRDNESIMVRKFRLLRESLAPAVLYRGRRG